MGRGMQRSVAKLWIKTERKHVIFGHPSFFFSDRLACEGYVSVYCIYLSMGNTASISHPVPPSNPDLHPCHSPTFRCPGTQRSMERFGLRIRWSKYLSVEYVSIRSNPFLPHTIDPQNAALLSTKTLLLHPLSSTIARDPNA